MLRGTLVKTVMVMGATMLMTAGSVFAEHWSSGHGGGYRGGYGGEYGYGHGGGYRSGYGHDFDRDYRPGPGVIRGDGGCTGARPPVVVVPVPSNPRPSCGYTGGRDYGYSDHFHGGYRGGYVAPVCGGQVPSRNYGDYGYRPRTSIGYSSPGFSLYFSK